MCNKRNYNLQLNAQRLVACEILELILGIEEKVRHHHRRQEKHQNKASRITAF